MGILSDLLGGVAADLYGEIPTEIKSLYTTALDPITAPDITFQPFTVTSGLGGVTAGPTGTAYTLSPQQQAIQDALMGSALGRFQQGPAGVAPSSAAGLQAMAMGQQALGQQPFGVMPQEQAAQQAFGLGQQFMGQAGMPTTDREAAVYERIRATQRPEEERQRMALEERLFAQGRGGVTTSQYGGTPEQLAMAQAQTEAQNRAMLGAMQQAQAEQAQQASLGGQFLQQSYAPQAALLSAFSPALNVAGLEDVARRQAGELGVEAQMANIQGMLGQQTGLAGLYGGIYGNLLGGLGGLLTGGEEPWWKFW